MSLSFEKEKNDKMSFLHVEISQKNGKFVTTIYVKLSNMFRFKDRVPYETV